MKKLHTAAEVENLNLPGFQSPATLAEMTAPGADWQPVLSLSIYSRDAESGGINILTGIRYADTPTHGNVVSTPTGRFPKAFVPAVLDSKMPHLLDAPVVNLAELDSTKTQTVATFAGNQEDVPDRNSPFVFVAHEVVARKMGLGDRLQNSKAHPRKLGTLSLAEMIAGFSYAADHPKTGEPLWEPLIMYGGVLLVDDPRSVPTDTAAYRSIGWTPVEDFMEGHERRNPLQLVPEMPEFDVADVCVRGLCLRTTSTITARPNLSEHLDQAVLTPALEA